MELQNENVMKTDNQKKQIVNYLMTKGPLTVLTAMQFIRCYALSQRIGELKKEGYDIHRRMIQVDSGKHVAEYYMKNS